LCPEHFDLVADTIENRMTEINSPTQVPLFCEHCDAPRVFTVQARVYRAHKEDEQYVVELCASCASVLGNNLHVYNEEPLPER
jgi:RNase P subunit RPR2